MTGGKRDFCGKSLFCILRAEKNSCMFDKKVRARRLADVAEFEVIKNMYNELKGQAAIVTGDSSGIGRGIAERFAAEGVDVVITGRHEATLKEAAASSDKIHYVVADMTNTDDVAKTVTYAKDHFGRLDILVNCAGWCPVQNIKEIKLEDYNRAFDLDVKAVVDMTIQSLPLLL